MHFESIIARNHQKSMAVIFTYIAIFIFAGLLLDLVRINAANFTNGLISLISFEVFPTITVVMCLIAGILIAYSISSFDRIMLSGSNYKEINPCYTLSTKEQKIYNLFHDLLNSARLPFTPKLYIIDAPYMNAFASGWNSRNSLIALTTGIIDRLSDEELQAVMAHELSHIRHGDIRLTLCVGILSNILLLIANYAVFFLLGGNRREGANTARNILLILQFVLPIFTFLLQMYLSRSREYMADSGAAYLMHDNRAMIRALQKISQDYSENDYKNLDINPTRKAAYIFSEDAFSTHPSIKNRIAVLLGKKYD
ncbi:zinc metalloprotease HtpX [Helicobacter mustelae]|uniref:Putative Heat shock protein, HtpX n=1 Tax=Helicobacter mustelae (strain ATCC 43772 / CCUG 25715 / CIP 103759 / LMG 18044 / NCTC 12198 / R85-136P) TaxID=679897 RepID=D3UJ18_HELM1|nr:zinc metalloprotease HtpX [Helicobacter mustelae]CBG40493.1 putative Heat shock protein, HtpX [Helicobacter mustelae 12198]SQH71992.1 heat shock protein HtpX [Helicobacter mustelae]STP13135.1 heat shock protein HtpX [Helicobacter mustelae]